MIKLEREKSEADRKALDEVGSFLNILLPPHRTILRGQAPSMKAVGGGKQAYRAGPWDGRDRSC